MLTQNRLKLTGSLRKLPVTWSISFLRRISERCVIRHVLCVSSRLHLLTKSVRSKEWKHVVRRLPQSWRRILQHRIWIRTKIQTQDLGDICAMCIYFNLTLLHSNWLACVLLQLHVRNKRSTNGFLIMLVCISKQCEPLVEMCYYVICHARAKTCLPPGPFM
jgi:hypothetical protein